MEKLAFLFLLSVLYSSCNQSAVDNESPLSFPNVLFSKVLAYPIKGHSGKLITEEGKVANALPDGTPLTKVQSNLLIGILNDPKALSNEDGLRCFNPEIGIVFFTKENRPVSQLIISLECNQIKGFPALEHRSFSMHGYQQIQTLVNEIL